MDSDNPSKVHPSEEAVAADANANANADAASDVCSQLTLFHRCQRTILPVIECPKPTTFTNNRERECPKDSERRQIDQWREDIREQQNTGGVQEPYMRSLWSYNYACCCPSCRERDWSREKVTEYGKR